MPTPDPTPVPTPTPSTKTIPGGVPTWAGEVLWLPNPPTQLKAAAAWMDGVQDTDSPLPGTIEIDWIKLHAIDAAGTDRVFAQVDYDNGRAEGGLFSRFPWFGTNANEPMPKLFAAGALVLNVSTRPDRVWHWWSFPRALVPAGAVRVWSESRVRVTGGAAVEVGYDYFLDLSSTTYIHNVTHAEGARGKWVFAAPDWQIITAGKP